MAWIELNTMVNDIDAQTFFAKNGPLSWFSPKKTYALAFTRGNLSDKQVLLVRSVYQLYSKFKEVSKRFQTIGESNKMAMLLYEILKEKPKVSSKEERSLSQRISRIIHIFRDGNAIHIGHFNEAELLVGELPIAEKDKIWEQIHTSRRVYLNKLYETSIKKSL